MKKDNLICKDDVVFKDSVFMYSAHPGKMGIDNKRAQDN